MIKLSTLTMARAHLNSALEYLGEDEGDPVFGRALEHVRVAAEYIEELDQGKRQRLVAAWQAFRTSASAHAILVSMSPGLCAICVHCAAGEELAAAFDEWMGKQ